MLKQNNYNTLFVSLPLFNEIYFSEDEPVVRFISLINKVDLRKFFKFKFYKDSRGRKALNRVNILAAIIFCFALNIRSTRKIYDACKYDSRILLILSGTTVKSHMTISNIINEVGDIDLLLSAINKQIINEDCNINTDEVYIDGTKIEAYANKYSFVWKKGIIKNKERLNEKIKLLFESINDIYIKNNIPNKEILLNYSYEELLPHLINFKKLLVDNKIEKVYGKGKRKTQEQRVFDLLDEYTSKMLEYENHLSIIGNNRESYSKTDHDATFMRMKEDYMRNGQLKPAYNLQISTSNGYIMLIGIFQDRTDFKTFIPTLLKYKELYGKFPAYPVADAGYGNYENYKFCEKNNIELVQKYSYFAYEDTTKYKKNKFSKDKFKINKKGILVCPHKKEMIFEKTINEYIFDGAKESKVYRCLNCNKCKDRKKCTKSEKGRTITINDDYERLKKVAKNNLKSDKGIELRINRSIQVEGAFAILKEDSFFDTVHRRGIKKVKLEIGLMAIAQNINRYLNWNSIKPYKKDRD